MADQTMPGGFQDSALPATNEPVTTAPLKLNRRSRMERLLFLVPAFVFQCVWGWLPLLFAFALSVVLSSVEHAIVFIDEVDKIRAQVSGAPNVRGIVAQEALLTLMENEHVAFEADGAEHEVNSSGILFVAGGAFEELYENVLRRATIGQDVTPLQPVVVVSASGEVREELPFHLRDYLKYEDLFRYGMTPQFVSRFESIVVLNDLAEADLAKIFVEPEGSIFRTSRDYFKRFGVDLQITRGALINIAWDASRQKRLGARALREIFRRVIRNLEFEPTAGVVTIDEQMVKKAITSRDSGRRER